MIDTVIRNRLEILPGGQIIVPGCEPTSAISSSTLLMAQQCANRPTVLLADALAAIPGSTIEFGSNYGMGIRMRWFVLPPRQILCPCVLYQDWYAILRALPRHDPVVTNSYGPCDTFGQGFCPSPDFTSAPAPVPSPYFQEGTSAFDAYRIKGAGT